MFPDRSFEIGLHRENARKFLNEKNFDLARLSYFKWIPDLRIGTP